TSGRRAAACWSGPQTRRDWPSEMSSASHHRRVVMPRPSSRSRRTRSTYQAGNSTFRRRLPATSQIIFRRSCDGRMSDEASAILQAPLAPSSGGRAAESLCWSRTVGGGKGKLATSADSPRRGEPLPAGAAPPDAGGRKRQRPPRAVLLGLAALG